MNTFQLTCFLSVAKTLNFSRTAQELSITQPAVSHQINTLEKELNVKLFHRTSKSVSLTQEGLQFLPDADDMLHIAVSAKERLASREQSISLAIGCHNQAELQMIPGILRDLKKEYPQLRPMIHIVSFENIGTLLENGRIQLMFGIRGAYQNPAFCYKEAFTCHMACVCAPDHPFATLPSITLEQLCGEVVLCIPHKIDEVIFQAQRQAGDRTASSLRYFGDGYEGTLALVKAGMGYTVLPDLGDVMDPELCCIPILDLPKISVGIYYLQQSETPLIRRFYQLLKASFSPSQPSFSAPSAHP